MKYPSLLAATLAWAITGPAMSAEHPILTVYTYDSFVSEWGPGPKVKEAFEKTCGCELKLVGAGDGAALLSRLRLEGTRTKADVVLGLDTNLTKLAAQTGLFAPHGKSLVNTALPIDWVDPLFLPFDWGYFAFVYDNTKLKTPPTSFVELAAKPDDFKIVIQDPRSSTPGLGLLMWIKSAYGDKAPDIWRDLSPNILTVTKGWSEAYGMFLEGEADMVLSYTTSPSYHIIAENDSSKSAAVFTEGHYLQVEVAGRLATSDQPELADAFLEFLMSEDFQSLIPTTNWMYPVFTPKGGLPEGFETAVDPATALMFTPKQALEARQPALTEWLNALSR